MGLNFTLPGHANIELRRGSRDTSVTIHNLHQYVALVTQWFLIEGVQTQFEALREGNLSDLIELQKKNKWHKKTNHPFLSFRLRIRLGIPIATIAFILSGGNREGAVRFKSQQLSSLGC